MKKLLLLFALVSLFACEKEQEITFISPNLVFPLNEEGIDFRTVDFQWNLQSVEVAQFKLFLESQPNEIIVENEVSSDMFTVENLLPGSKYSWSIEFGDEILSSSFTTRNPLAVLKDQYEVITTYQFWDSFDINPEWDTTYVDTVNLSLIENGINIKMSGGIDRKCDFVYLSEDGRISYFDYYQGWSNQADFIINEELGKATVIVRSGGSGSGYVWSNSFQY